MANLKGTANVLADKALLEMLASHPDTRFSKAALQTVLDVLDKVALPSSLDHGILLKIFDCLRSWSSSEDVSSVLPFLTRVYDNLIHRDLGQANVSNSVCELLFLIEDLADDRECKIIAGEQFLQRLLVLAGSKLTGIKLQRAAVETLSSIILMCPTNQKLLLEDLIPEWHNLVKKVLPLCGDFFVQASIVEILYRLSKRSPRLLDCLEDKTLREKMASLHQKKKPDLLADTRSFLDHLNQSLGKSRSVYSFLAEDIIFDGQSTLLKNEKWVHFGMDHMSCYAALDLGFEKKMGKISESVSIMDVFYNRIYDIQVCSNHTVEFAFRESMSPAQNTWIRIKTIKLKVVLKSEELGILKDSVLLRINQHQKESQKGGSKGVDSENTNTTPSFSATIERSFRKASIGFAIPLPRKFKLPSVPRSSNEQIDVNTEVFENLKTDPKVFDRKSEVQPITKGTSSEPTQVEATCKTGCIDKEVVDCTAEKSSSQVFQVADSTRTGCIDKGDYNAAKPFTQVFQVATPTIIKEHNNCSPPCKPEVYKESGPKQDTFSCSQPVDNCKILPRDSKDVSTSGPKKICDDRTPSSRKDAVSSRRTNAFLNTIDSGLITNASSRPNRRTGFGNKEHWDNEGGGSHYELVEKASSHDTAGAVENAMQHNPLSKGRNADTKALTPKDDKSANLRQATDLQERILNILSNANLPEFDAHDTRKPKNSTSDPIETDSEQKRSVPENIRAKKTSRSTLKRKTRDPCQGQEVSVTLRSNRRSHLELEKDERHLIKNKAPERDVFSFDEGQQSPAEDQHCTAAKDRKDKRFTFNKSKDGTYLAKDQNFPADDQQCAAYKDTKECVAFKDTKEKLFESSSSKSRDDHHRGKLFKDPAMLFKASGSKSRNNNHITDPIQSDAAAISPNLCTIKLTEFEQDVLCESVRRAVKDPAMLLKASCSKRRDDNHITDPILSDAAAISPNLCTTKVTDFKQDFLFRSVRLARQRKRELDIERSPAKKIKEPPAVIPPSDENGGLLLSREVSACFTSMASPLSVGKSNDELDKELLMSYSSPEQTRKDDTNISWKSPCLKWKARLPIIPIAASPAIEGSCPETYRRARRRKRGLPEKNQKLIDVNLSLLNEDIQTAEIVDFDAVPNGEMQLVAELIQKMMKKIKVKTEDKSTQILTCAMEAVQQCCQEVQEQIKTDLDECTKTSRETFEQIQQQLEEQHETFLGIQKKWRNEFDNGLSRFKEISSQVDSSQSHLKSISDKQKIEHRRLFSSMGEFVELHLNETEQKLLALQKAARGIRNELKGALLRIF